MSQVMVNALVGKDNISEAFRKGLEVGKTHFFRMFSGYISFAVIYFYLAVSVTLFTVGVGTLLLVPFATVFIVCIRLVDCFTVNKKKYFIDYDNIVVPKELRDTGEELLSDVEI